MIMSGWSYFPLSFATLEGAPSIIKGVEEKVEELKRSGKLPPGTAEQYDLQIEALKNPKIPDCQTNFYPGYFGQPTEGQSPKAFVIFGRY